MSFFEQLNGTNALHSVLVEVTPEMAAEFLERNTFNRPVSDYWVRQYVKSMQEGSWSAGTQITFDDNGVLADGQKRLVAVVRSNTTQCFFVAFNVPADFRGNVDVGQPRGLEHRLSLTGTPANRELVGAARIYAEAPFISQNRADQEVVRRAIETQRDRLTWACSLGIRNAAVNGTLARASHYVSEEILEEFARSFNTSICYDPNRNSAAMLKNFSIRNRNIFSGSNPVNRNTSYKFTQAAIKSFEQARPISRCREVQADIYSLPSEVRDVIFTGELQLV